MSSYLRDTKLTTIKIVKLLFVFSFVLLVTIILPISATAHAKSQITHAAQTWYVTPSVYVNPACGTTEQNVFPFTDDWGNASEWTYTNGSYLCVGVTWTIPGIINTFSRDCVYYVYVPIGNATTNINYGMWVDNYQGGTTKVLNPIKQNDSTGFTQLTEWIGSGVKSISMSDNNGTYTEKLGWGKYNSLRVNCVW